MSNGGRIEPATGSRKINVLLGASTLWVGGAEMVVKHLAQTMDRERFNVTVCHLKQRGSIGNELANSGIDVVGIDAAGSGAVNYLTFLKLRHIVKTRRIHVVHTHMTHALVDASLCKLSMPRLKLVHTFHFGNYPHTEKRVLGLERVFSRVPDRLCAVGERQRQQILRVFGFRDRRIATVHNGVELREPSIDTTFRRSVGAVDRPLIGTIATFIEQKGLRDLLRVARRCKDVGCPARFVVVGEGHLRHELEQLRRDLDLEDTVHLTGWIQNAAAVLPTFDIFFQPSLWEAMSMVVLEAMAASRAIVATTVGENPLILADGLTALLVPPGDVDAMASAILGLIDRPERGQAMGHAAREVVRERFTVAHTTRAYERIYSELVS